MNYWKEFNSATEDVKNKFIAWVKRTIREWPVCENGGAVELIFLNNSGYFYCDKCGNESLSKLTNYTTSTKEKIYNVRVISPRFETMSEISLFVDDVLSKIKVY